jgi:hypothetical protein
MKVKRISHSVGSALLNTGTFFFSTGFYSPYRTLAFLNGLLDPQTFGRTPWLGDQSNANTGTLFQQNLMTGCNVRENKKLVLQELY